MNVIFISMFFQQRLSSILLISVLVAHSVPLIALGAGNAAASDIATPAAKAAPSELYSPHTAWELGFTGKGVNIAIMDTGIDDAHPSLSGKFLGGADFSKPETIFTPRDGTFNPDDTNGHGTTCAGIATGTGAPSGEYAGVAIDTRLVDLRIGTTFGFSPGEGPQDQYDAALQATDWATAHHDIQWEGAAEEYHGIDIISLSWGIPYEGSSDGSDRYSQALDRATDAGIVCVVAVGNEGPDNEGMTGMSAASKVITVGATDDLNTIDRSDDVIAEYSTRGPRDDNGDGYPYDELKPDLTAPGTNIMQAMFDRTGDGSGNGYGNRGSGTSYAAPLVAGVAALMLEANPALGPRLVKEILRATSERRGEPTYPELDPFWNRDFGWGMVDAYNATRMAMELGGDVGTIDPELQCFVMNKSVDVDAGTVTLEGSAWSRTSAPSSIDRVELRIDNGSWRSRWVELIDGDEDDAANASRYRRWRASIPTSSIGKGNHTIEVRSVSGESYSLVSETPLQIRSVVIVEERAVVGGWTIAGIVIGAIVAVAGVVLYLKWQKKNESED